jgi:hypothetical protein
MHSEFSVFFNIPDLNNFFKEHFFYSGNGKYSYKIIKREEMKGLTEKKNTLYYEGYTYKQKNSFVIYQNTDFDGWINKVRLSALNNRLKAVHIFIDNESLYPGYRLDYYENSFERVIYSIKDGTKWIFFEKGLQQPFEMNDRYEEKGATKKFNYSKLKLFCKNLGIDLDDLELLAPTSDIYYDYRVNSDTSR